MVEQLTEAADDFDLPKPTPIQLASETHGRDLLQVLLQEVHALPDVWPKLTEKKQAAVIERLEITARQAEHKGNLRDRPISINRISGCSRRELKQRDEELAKRAQALANARMPVDHIRKKLGFSPVAFEQFIARHGIRLPASRSTP